MPRVLTARFMHETNTFSRVKTHDDRTGLACLPLFSALAEFERPVRGDTLRRAGREITMRMAVMGPAAG